MYRVICLTRKRLECLHIQKNLRFNLFHKFCILGQKQCYRHQSILATTSNFVASENVNLLNKDTLKDDTLSLFSLQAQERDLERLAKMRNFGISAHIDSGKTTLTERILFYSGRIKMMHEVRGGDKVGAKMDSMELERERGITIQSAATYTSWRDCNFNIIDTPGHIDFTIEVERALRVLDGAILVVCGVSGVQSQTITVDRQMRRYNVPRLIFINKLDRAGANPWKVVQNLKVQLKIAAAVVQIPIGIEDKLRGTINLIEKISIIHEGRYGETLITGPVPTEFIEEVRSKRSELIESLAEVDDEIAEMFLNDVEPTPDQIKAAIRRATISNKFVPVFFGSAYRNIGVQPLLDGVCDFLPSPSDVSNNALCSSLLSSAENQSADIKGVVKNCSNQQEILPFTETKVPLLPYSGLPLVALAFKLEEGRYGQLTYVRVYQGLLSRGAMLLNTRTGKRIRASRVVRTHSDELEDVGSISAGEIGALFGVECASGDTFMLADLFGSKSNNETKKLTMSSIHVPEPVVSLALSAAAKEDSGNARIIRAIRRFEREDPTFRMVYDSESKEMIISGMGELHLEIYVERMKREYSAVCVTGKPRVAFREAPTCRVYFNFTHKRQSGGAGQFGRVIGYIEPIDKEDVGKTGVEFRSRVAGGAIPFAFLVACEKGFREAIQKGKLSGNPITGIRMVIEDGLTHVVDSNEISFRLATIGALRQAMENASAVVIEPIMSVDVTVPVEYIGDITGSIVKRQGVIFNSEVQETHAQIQAEVKLNLMFGYSAYLRSATQGKGEFTMEFLRYRAVNGLLQAQLAEEYEKEEAKRIAMKK